MRNLVYSLILGAMVFAAGCGSDSDDAPATPPGIAPASGSGTQADPFVIQVNTDYAGNIGPISSLGGLDIWYQFAATTTGFYTGSLTNNTTDLQLDFFDQNQNFVDSCDNVFVGPEVCSTSAIPFTLSSGLTYYIGVWNWDDTASGYTLRVSPD